MRALKVVIIELFGLFVDDGRFALAIVIWLGVVGMILTRIETLRTLNGVILFVGLAAILVESALHRTRG